MTQKNHSARPSYRLGILGLGEGRSILSAALSSRRWKISAVGARSEESCAKRKREFNLECPAYTDYAKMLADGGIDVIGIFTPDPLHADHILQALEAGKHVICTKPVVDSLERGAELVEAQRRSGKQIFVGHSYRFFQTFLRQREDFESGIHGGLVSCEACYNGDKRQGSAGARGKKGEVNWLYSGLGHAVDLVYWYLGEIDEVSGYSLLSDAGRALGSAVDDCFQFVLKAKSGALGHAMGIYGTPHAHPQAAPVAGCTLRGNLATTTATNPTFDYYTAIDGKPPQRETYVDDGGYYFPWGGSSYHAGEFQNFLEHFADCLDSDERPSPNLHDALYVVGILEAMELALSERRAVKVAEVLQRRHLTAKLNLHTNYSK
jgi:predicted dehydrogenase